MEPVEITAGRLHLRPFAPADEDDVYAACQDAEIQRWTRVPSPYTREHARQFLIDDTPRNWRDDTAYTFAVCDSVSGDVLATVSLHRKRTDNVAEIGYWCAAWARGRGVTTEAVGAVCRWGFAGLGIARIEWHAAVGNPASRRVAEKAGFSIEGRLRSRLELSGVRHDAWVGGLLPDDVSPPPR
ncbi:MAG: GNAT family N-acetyltransferase [Actinomycetes bacterium]